MLQLTLAADGLKMQKKDKFETEPSYYRLSALRREVFDRFFVLFSRAINIELGQYDEVASDTLFGLGPRATMP